MSDPWWLKVAPGSELLPSGKPVWMTDPVERERLGQVYDEMCHREAEEDERQIRATHQELVTAASGLRKAVLELHGPGPGRYYEGCAECDGEGMSNFVEHPCRTYVLARDWRDS